MTDVPGTFAIVIVPATGCLRALQASTTGASAASIPLLRWPMRADEKDTRQISWLGVLVMISGHPRWLLRRQRRVVIAGTIAVVAGIAIVAGSVKWLLPCSHILTASLPYSIGSARRFGYCSTGF